MVTSSCRFICLLLGSLFLLSSCAPLQDRDLNTDPALLSDSFDEDLQAYQESLIDEETTGSNFLMVVRDGQEIYRSTANSGRSGDRDITDKTLFPIWSMSKPITIVAMHLLHEQGLFQWKDPVSQYIPCFENLTVAEGETVRAAKTPLLIEHLMNHRAGYGYYTPWPGMPPMGTTNPPSYHHPHTTQTRFDNLQQFCEAAAETPLAFDPGTSFLYGINQAILGRLVEVLTGKSFAESLQELIFTPLEMNRTGFVLEESQLDLFQPLFINSGDLFGYTNLLNELTYSPKSQAHFGGEGLISCPEDYSRFCEMLAGGGMFRGQRFLSEESLQKMTTTSTVAAFGDVTPAYDMADSVFVLNNPQLEGSLAPVGCFGWSGYHNTHFWIDPANQLYGLFFTRAREYNFDLPINIRKALYGEIE